MVNDNLFEDRVELDFEAEYDDELYEVKDDEGCGDH